MRHQSLSREMIERIKAARRRIKSEFTPGCRIEFRAPGPYSVSTIRRGKGRFLRLIETASGLDEKVVYSVDCHNQGRPLGTTAEAFLRDDPAMIPEDE